MIWTAFLAVIGIALALVAIAAWRITVPLFFLAVAAFALWGYSEHRAEEQREAANQRADEQVREFVTEYRSEIDATVTAAAECVYSVMQDETPMKDLRICDTATDSYDEIYKNLSGEDRYARVKRMYPKLSEQIHGIYTSLESARNYTPPTMAERVNARIDAKKAEDARAAREVEESNKREGLRLVDQYYTTMLPDVQTLAKHTLHCKHNWDYSGGDLYSGACKAAETLYRAVDTQQKTLFNQLAMLGVEPDDIKEAPWAFSYALKTTLVDRTYVLTLSEARKPSHVEPVESQPTPSQPRYRYQHDYSYQQPTNEHTDRVVKQQRLPKNKKRASNIVTFKKSAPPIWEH